MCAFIKSIQNELDECPTTLLLEPTDKLKNEMIERFQKYGINAVDYGKKRQIIKGAVNITHPASLNNDLEKDENILKDIKVYMCDECLQNKSKVLLPNNKYMTIEEIYNNPFINEVMSYNLEKNIYEPKRIIRKIKSENQDRKCFYTIQYINPITNEINKLRCTGNHKIWTKNRGYVRADELTLNDEIKIDTNNISKLYICKKCGKEFSNNSSSGGHINFHDEEYINRLKEKLKQQLEKYNPLSDPEIRKKAMQKRSQNKEYCKYLSERMKGDKNPSKRADVKEKIGKSIKKLRETNLEFKAKCLQNFVQAPYKAKGKNMLTKFEQKIIDMNIPGLEYTGDGRIFYEFKNGKNKNPDFVFKNKNEIKVIEVGDIYHWHTLEEIEEVKQQYKLIGLDCLYLINEDLNNLKETEGKIRKFLFNHHVKPIKIYKSKGPKYKYNLEVEDNHNYWADGILVSNCHHSGAETYKTTILNIPSAEYTIGVSASAVSQEHIGEKNIANYDINEIETMSMLGTVSMNITASDLINQSKLAKPVLLIINNPANEPIDKKKSNDWHEINKKRLQSPARTKQIAETSVFFSKRNRKTLILVNTKDYAYNIAKVINELGLNDQCRLSFGGKVFLKYNSTNNEFEKDDSDTFQDYRDGKISILIGTQHLVEGVDVPSLDVVILAYCGKSERIQIQSCGRVLRLTKNGNMAYIVDFSDEKDPILNYQFKTRLKNYLTTIGVNRNDVYVIDPMKIDEDTSIIFNKYEN